MPYALSHGERLILLAILIAGAWLRFQHLGAIEYNIDQVYPIWQAIETLDEGKLPLVGQGTSVLFANPPLTGYFFVPVIAVFRQPVAVFVFTLALNTFAIFLVYRALIRLVRRRPITAMYPALFGTALFALSPWIIEDSRRTWVQSLLPFFMAAIMWALAPVLTGQTNHPRRRLMAALVALALVAHTYLLAYALIAPMAILLVVAWRWRPDRFHKRHIAAGIAIFAVFMLLYGIGLRRDWDYTSARAEKFTSGDATLSTEALEHAVRLVTGWDYAEARGMTAPADDAELRDTLSDGVHWLWVIALAAGMGQAVRALMTRIKPAPPERDSAVILLVWFWLPVLMFSYVSRSVHPFYLLLSVPAGFGLVAWGIRPLLRSARLTYVLVAFTIFTGVINGLNVVRFAEDSAAHPGADLPETLPLQQARELGDRLKEAGAPDLAAFSPMHEWTPITLVGHHFRTEETQTYGTAALVPENGGIYVLIQPPTSEVVPTPPPYAVPAGEPLVLEDGAAIALWRVTPDDLTIAEPADFPSDIDVSFAGWTLREALEPGATVTLDTFWRIETLHPERGIWAFMPLGFVVDGDDQQIVSAQGNAVSALTWAAGDLWVQPLTFAVPDDAVGPFTIRLALFDSVRVREDGVQGINAIFRVPQADGETLFTPEIVIAVGE